MGRGAWEATVYGTEKNQTQWNPSFCEKFFQLNIIGAWWPCLQVILFLKTLGDKLPRKSIGTLFAWKWKSVTSDSLWPHGLYSPWNSPGQKTGVGSLSLLQGIFPTQGSDWGILHCRQILYQLSYRRMKIPSFTEPGESLWCKLRSLQGLTNM